MSIAALRKFVEEDLWRIQLAKEPVRRRLWLKPLRIAILTIREFGKDQCSLRASALTFYTLLSIVPVLALAFGVAKGFGMESKLEEAVRRAMQVEAPAVVAPAADGSAPVVAEPTGTAVAVERAIEFASNMLAQTSGGAVAGVGVIVLLWTVIKLLGQIEIAMNSIWLIESPRSFFRKLTDYLSVMVIAPIVFVVAGSLTGILNASVDKVPWLAFLGGPLRFALSLVPTLLVSLLFAFLYVFMPNGRTRASSALAGGLFAGILYQIVQLLYIKFNVGVASAGAVYGSFAALPLFLSWVQLSWMIVLLGAEFAFAHQFCDISEFEQDARRASPRFVRLAALCVARESVASFAKGEPAPSAEDIARRVGLPYQVAKEVVNRLVAAQVLSEVHRPGRGGIGYQPALDIGDLRAADVLLRLDDAGNDAIPFDESETRRALASCIDAFRAAAAASDANLRLRDA